MKTPARLFLLLTIALVTVAFFTLGLSDYLSLPWLKAQQLALMDHVEANPMTASMLYFGLYVGMAAFSLPGASLLTLAAGALFGLGWGLVLVSFASALGATLAMLVARYLFRDFFLRRYRRVMEKVDRGINHEGAFYLASLRLVPLFPFFVINLVMGLTAIRPWTFYWVSQITMLPATLVYVNAGTQLGQIAAPGDILSPDLLVSLAVLALFPLIARIGVGFVRRRRVYSGWARPRRFDFNLLVVGAGSGGLVAAYIAAAVKARVCLVEAERMGGDCLNTGCVPSKALIKSSRLVHSYRQAGHYGIDSAEPAVSFGAVMERVEAVIRQVEPHDSTQRYRGLGVDCVSGLARFRDPWTVEVTDYQGGKRCITARSVVIATGAKPRLPPIEGIDDIMPLTSDNLWSLRQQPKRLLVLGGGPVGAELAQAFARLGSAVTLVDRGAQLLSKEDPDVSAAVLNQFRQEDIEVLLHHEAVRFAVEGGEKVLYARAGEALARLPFDQVLVALGRKPNTEGLDLEAIGIKPEEDGTLPAADDMSLKFPHLYACGDVAGPYQFTHSASYQAWFAAVNGLFGTFKRFRVDYSTMPWVTFTSPEIGRVGLNEADARNRNVGYEVTRFELGELDRAITDGEDRGFIKILTVPGKDRILGAVIVGSHAGELLGEFILAMKHGIGLNKILGTIHPYPTWNEGAKAVAGQWKRDHAPERVLRWLQRYHRYRL